MAQVGALSNADSIDCEGYDPTNSVHEWVRVPIDHHHWHGRYHYKQYGDNIKYVLHGFNNRGERTEKCCKK